MNRFTGNLAVKTAAVLLFALAVAACLTSAGGVLYLHEQQNYGEVDSYYQTSDCANTAMNQAVWVVWDYQRVHEEGESRLWEYEEQASNFSYTLARAASPERILESTEWPAQVGYGSEMVVGDYIIRYAVADPLVARDAFWQQARLFDALYPWRWALIWVTAGLGLLIVILLVFILSAAGRRSGVPGVTLGPVHHVPLDLIAGLVPLAGMILWGVIDYRGFYGWADAALLIVGLTLLSLVVLGFLATWAARIKAGQWWRNTLIWRLLRLAGTVLRATGRGIGAAVRHIPLYWRAAAGFCLVAIIQFALALAAPRSEPAILLLFLFNLFLLAGVCVAAVNLHILQRAAARLAAGKVGQPGLEQDAQIGSRWLFGGFRRHGENLNRIREGMAQAVEDRLKSERLKTDLITNVSHDIKTPLTSLINYVDLLKKEELPGPAESYVEVLDRQSQRLHKLTDDLLEASKASSGNLAVDLTAADLGEMVNQAVGEYAERLAAARLDPVVALPPAGAPVVADGKLMWRVLDNLLSNAVKYAMPGTRVYFDVEPDAAGVVLTVKNISAQPLNMDATELMERFVRGDASRASEGSGLGLSIARSLVELQRGHFEMSIDGDLFKTRIRLPAGRAPDRADPTPA